MEQPTFLQRNGSLLASWQLVDDEVDMPATGAEFLHGREDVCLGSDEAHVVGGNVDGDAIVVEVANG